jgi:hypothetical protein
MMGKAREPFLPLPGFPRKRRRRSRRWVPDQAIRALILREKQARGEERNFTCARPRPVGPDFQTLWDWFGEGVVDGRGHMLAVDKRAVRIAAIRQAYIDRRRQRLQED